MRAVMLVLVAVALGPTAVRGQSQAEMNAEARAAHEKADARLNTVYKQILKQHARDVRFTARFRAAQRAWVQFRDAHVAAIYPEPDKANAYGSVYPLCRWRALTELIEERTKQLQSWVEGADETDTCAGSRKTLATNNPNYVGRLTQMCLASPHK